MAKLRDPRWQKRRLEVFQRDKFTCQMCWADEESGRNLQIHHAYYSREFENPWEYPSETLYTMCELCHVQAETIKQQIYERLAYVTPRLQHHVYYGIGQIIDEFKAGEPLECIDVPWAIKKNESA